MDVEDNSDDFDETELEDFERINVSEDEDFFTILFF